MPLIPLDRRDDPRLDVYRGVRDPELLRSGGRFIAEGRLVVRRLLASDRFAAESVLVTPAALAGLTDALEPHRDRLPVYVVALGTLRSLSGFNLHRGCLAVGVRPAAAPWTTVLPSAPGPALVVALEGLANADNVGGSFRNAQAFGADAVLLDAACCDPLYRKAIRTSMGASLVVPYARLEGRLTTLLRDAGLAVVALTPDEQASPVREASALFRSRQRVALLVGNEGRGLRPDTLAEADLRVRIPMTSGADSLNAAAALAIGLYVCCEARRTGGW